MEKKITIAAPCYNEEMGIGAFLSALQAIGNQLEDSGYKITFLLIDDGSTDQTLMILTDYSNTDPRIRIASFSRNFGHQAAVSAAIDLADANALILMDADMQHPPQCIPQMIQAWEEGHDIVSMVRQETVAQKFMKNFTSRIFYKFFNSLSDTKVANGAADFFLLSERAQNALKQLPEYHQFWRGLVSWIGFNRKFIEYTAAQRAAGSSKYSISKMLGLAIDGMTSFSTKPIKVIVCVGFLTAACGALYLAYILFCAFVLKDTVHGWSSLIATTIIIGGIQILVMGMIGNYTAKIFEQVKSRPRYILKKNTYSNK
ncbi:MAG: glycosyltransferase family 2 protein [Chthoniobacterales bacterium]